MAKPVESLPALFPSHQFGSRQTREMSFILGNGTHAHNLLVIDEGMSLIRRELIAIASEAIGTEDEAKVTFSITFDRQEKRQ